MSRVLITSVLLCFFVYPSHGQIILIDPGHGRCDEPQHANPIHGVTYNHHMRLLTELETSVAVGLKLRTLIQNSSCNWTVHMTREHNNIGPFMVNSARKALSNTLGADIYLSIHTNAGPSNVDGAETFWCDLSSVGSTSFAQSLHAIYVSAVAGIPIGDRRVAEWKEYIGANNHLTVLANNTATSCLNELGFGTNTAEAAKLNNDANRDIFAQAFFDAVQAELNTNCNVGCPQTANITDSNIGGTTSVSNSIDATGTVPVGNTALFDAGTFIDLQTGFEAEFGSVFEGQIAGCSPVRRGIPNEKHNRLQSLFNHQHSINVPIVHVFKNSKDNTLVFRNENINPEKIRIYNQQKEMIKELLFEKQMTLEQFEAGTYYIRFYSDNTYIEHIEKIVLI